MAIARGLTTPMREWRVVPAPTVVGVVIAVATAMFIVHSSRRAGRGADGRSNRRTGRDAECRRSRGDFEAVLRDGDGHQAGAYERDRIV